MARKSGFVRRAGRMVRETSWVRILPTDTTLATASAGALFTGFSAATLALRPFTIIRTRGFVSLRSDQQAVTEIQNAILAMAVVSDQALAIGVSAVPLPSSDGDSDLFFVYEELMSSLRFIDATGIVEPNNLFSKFDSKAMRRVEEGSDVAITVETTAISIGAIISKGGRMLLKLH